MSPYPLRIFACTAEIPDQLDLTLHFLGLEAFNEQAARNVRIKEHPARNDTRMRDAVGWLKRRGNTARNTVALNSRNSPASRH